MRSLILALVLATSWSVGPVPLAFAQEGSNPPQPSQKSLKPSVADWLPDTTQGFARVIHFPDFLESWGKTQFGLLAKDERLQPFWKEQRKTIEGRLAEAGWQLNLTVDDISEIAAGQSAIAWISKPQNPAKPYAVALITDVAGNEEALKKLLTRIDEELKSRQATAQQVDHTGASITQYTLPRGPGEVVIHESFYAVVDGFLIATDELASMKEILNAQKAGRPDALSQSKLFTQALGHIPSSDTQSHLEYFVQPLGLAKLLRTISGKPVTSQTDVLKVLDKQGFSKLAAAVGRVRFGDKSFDIFHEAFVQTEPPLPISVQVLDFPNLVTGKIPSWVTPRASSFLEAAWNAKEAFWKVKDLVDDIAGQPGVFDSVIDGIQADPLGPQIDIKNEVLPFISPNIYSVSEIVEPVTTDSRRTLIGIRINDPKGKLAAALDRAMKNEPDATPEDFENFRIWKVTRDDGSEEAPDINFDFGPKKGSKSKPIKEDEPLLSNWAITVFSKVNPENQEKEEFLMFASHAEMIKEAIQLGMTGKQTLPLEFDVERVIQSLDAQTKGQPSALWEISRSDRAFRMQYELFRQDKLPQSRSMLATILDRILRPKDELKNIDQQVKGDKLPPFESIKQFFMPSGSRVVTQPDGWAYQGFVLSKPH